MPLYRLPERPTLRPMITIRRHIICILLLVLPLSSLAGVPTSCIQDGEPSLAHEVVVDAGALDGGVHHGSRSQTQDEQVTASHQHIAQGDDAAPVDCPCCDHCVTMCVMSGCGVVTINADSPDLSLDTDGPSVPPPDLFRVGPTPHPLFRPPIPIS